MFLPLFEAQKSTLSAVGMTDDFFPCVHRFIFHRPFYWYFSDIKWKDTVFFSWAWKKNRKHRLSIAEDRWMRCRFHWHTWMSWERRRVDALARFALIAFGEISKDAIRWLHVAFRSWARFCRDLVQSVTTSSPCRRWKIDSRRRIIVERHHHCRRCHAWRDEDRCPRFDYWLEW